MYKSLLLTALATVVMGMAAGFDKEDTSYCHGRGYAWCKCKPGWSGDMCQIGPVKKYCSAHLDTTDVSATLDEACGRNTGRGVCVENGTAPYCQCNTGWEGRFCQQTDDKNKAFSYNCTVTADNNMAHDYCSTKMKHPAHCVPNNANCWYNNPKCAQGWCVLSSQEVSDKLESERKAQATPDIDFCNVPQGGEVVCNCTVGWTGKDCLQPEDPCTESLEGFPSSGPRATHARDVCGAHGTCSRKCDSQDACQAVCNCDAGWTGTHCQNPDKHNVTEATRCVLADSPAAAAQGLHTCKSTSDRCLTDNIDCGFLNPYCQVAKGWCVPVGETNNFGLPTPATDTENVVPNAPIFG